MLIDCHSMPHEAIESHTRPGQPRPEVVLGDRYGAAAGREVMDRIEAAFAAAGLRVARNAPFAGAYVAQAYGRPSRGVHVVQVEIDRALYMDEARIEPAPGFDDFRRLIAGVVAELSAGSRSFGWFGMGDPFAGTGADLGSRSLTARKRASAGRGP
jgi:N-formylglutamate amidohydrolase